ncbi:GntR family transcriptional regulator [Mycolicibacterium murale]|nr:GntR family transcriptional regulator [Mycolicibacterium murale]MCV7180422.1 GntR family transcriptional regulator [Mycolicibacterium murale]
MSWSPERFEIVRGAMKSDNASNDGGLAGGRVARPLRARGSLTDQAKEIILRSIIAGDYPNDRMPKEDDLAEQLGVSRTTIRAALQALERAGLIARRQGIGTVINQHVRPANLGLQRLAGFEVLLEESGYVSSIEVETEYLAADPELAGHLAVPQGSECLVTRKTFYADTAPAVYVVDAVAAEWLVGRPDAAHLPENLYEFYERYHEMRLDHSVVDISPRIADGDVGAALLLKRGTPLLVLHELHYTFEGRRMGSSIAEVNDHYLHFNVIRR